jgi:hypothetical protein
MAHGIQLIDSIGPVARQPHCQRAEHVAPPSRKQSTVVDIFGAPASLEMWRSEYVIALTRGIHEAFQHCGNDSGATHGDCFGKADAKSSGRCTSGGLIHGLILRCRHRPRQASQRTISVRNI